MTYLENKRIILTIIIIYPLLQTLYNGSLSLHPDEAYYWVWSHYFDLSFYDYPSKIAIFSFFIWFATTLTTLITQYKLNREELNDNIFYIYCITKGS